MRADDWHRSIGPLRAWFDAHVLYLWAERAPGDYRTTPNPARDFAALIRDVVRKEWGRSPVEIRFLDRPPNREDLITVRRIREHHESSRRREAVESQRLFEYAKEECRRLHREAGEHLVHGSHGEKIRKVRAIVIARAKARLETERRRVKVPPRRAPPPDDPTTQPANSSGGQHGIGATSTEDPHLPRAAVFPRPTVSPASPSTDAGTPYVGSSELRAALEGLPWLTAGDGSGDCEDSAK